MIHNRFYIRKTDVVLKYYDFTSPVSGKGKWTFPIEGAVDVTSGFGSRKWDDESKENHKGLDFGCINHVTPIYAARQGRVVYSQFHKNKSGAPGYGNLVILQHGKGLYSGDAHLSETSVRKGQAIKEGQQIGVCGSKGHSTGPHLHFEVKTSEWGGHLNPKSVLGL
ncbi:M23 family metallopeptidase [Fictibacillus sp. FJAT-27399]|uniref:M23 family metallopeptidase n=1 Tax=Fictibacillus sp. FJAT-27399 TaxID=1729689 RepID=UPI000783DE8C|nr:M23 family metallopeptidase [Fictibacillus sp. FJAT-27399]